MSVYFASEAARVFSWSDLACPLCRQGVLSLTAGNIRPRRLVPCEYEGRGRADESRK